MEQDHYFPTSDIVSSRRLLYTPSSFARSSLLFLQETGILQALKVHTSSRSGLSSYLFFIVLSGSGTLKYDGMEYKLAKGNMVFIDCRKPYSHTTDQENLWSLQWCHFSGLAMSSIYSKYLERGGRPVLKEIDAKPFQDALDELYQTGASSDYVRDMKINEELCHLCTLLMKESWHPENLQLSVKKNSVMQIKEYIDQNYQQAILLDDLSRLFYINKYYLARVFKEQTGQTISSYLISLRITHAKQMLRFTDKTVEEIGRECGFENPSYFSRAFKKIEGVSPRDYRRRW